MKGSCLVREREKIGMQIKCSDSLYPRNMSYWQESSLYFLYYHYNIEGKLKTLHVSIMLEQVMFIWITKTFLSNYSSAETRNSSELNYQIPHEKQKYLKHSFYCRSIHFWNKLQTDIKSVDSVNTFKNRL